MNTASRFVLIFLALFRVSALEASIETISVVNAVDGRPIAGALVVAAPVAASTEKSCALA